MPNDVGEALVAYLRQRGAHQSDRVFLTPRAPIRPIEAAGVRSIVRRGYLRAGLQPVAAHQPASRAREPIGTAILRSVEAGTSQAQREATATDLPTVLTRAFSGRLARGIQNRWHDEYGADAPRAYPEIHHLTAPLRAHGRVVGDRDLINLWAGQAHQLAAAQSAEVITANLGSQALAAISAAAISLGARTPRADGLM